MPDFYTDPTDIRASYQAILDSGCWPEEEEHIRTAIAQHDEEQTILGWIARPARPLRVR